MYCTLNKSFTHRKSFHTRNKYIQETHLHTEQIYTLNECIIHGTNVSYTEQM